MSVSDSQIEEFLQTLLMERKAAYETLKRVSDQIVDCEIALSHRRQIKHPNDPDYPTFIKTSRDRIESIFEKRQK